MNEPPTLVLGVESSCDETAASVVDGDLRVRSSVVASQDELHAPYGGVVPEIASRRHLATVIPCMETALGQAEVTPSDLAGVAVTRGPGLIGALLVGVQAAKAFAWVHGLPVVGVNHLHAHIMAVRIESSDGLKPDFPYVALLVSGGHTALYEVSGWTQIRLLGQTRDDAAGEALDKFARMAGLGYPGGPIVDRLAQSGDPSAIGFPRGMSGRGLDFSFSGLKTAVRTHLEAHGVPQGQGLADLCASVQEAVADVLVEKSLAACMEEGIARLVLSGGVAANSRLRALARERGQGQGVVVSAPPLGLCTDNAAMVAALGVRLLDRGSGQCLGVDSLGIAMDATATLPISS